MSRQNVTIIAVDKHVLFLNRTWDWWLNLCWICVGNVALRSHIQYFRWTWSKLRHSACPNIWLFQNHQGLQLVYNWPQHIKFQRRFRRCRMPIMTMGRFGCRCGPFWTLLWAVLVVWWAVLDSATGRFGQFLGTKIFGAVLVGAVLAMGRFGIVPFTSLTLSTAEAIIVPHWIIRRWYTGRWWVDCYIWYSEQVQAPLRCTKCNSPPINGQCTNRRIAV